MTLYQDYMATGIKILAESYLKVHGGELHLPSFIEMTHEKKQEESVEQIMGHLKKVFS